MNIAVTGGAGFIGSNLCDLLVKKNHNVLCIDNFHDYYSPEKKRQNIRELMQSKLFELCECDVKNAGQLTRVFKQGKVEAVAHLAAVPGVRQSIEKPLPYLNNNIVGTMNVLEAAKECKVKKFVFASSSSVYGDSKKIPFVETDKADSQLSPYAFTKRSGELLCRTYHNLYGLPVVCLRLFTVYGPRNRPDMAVGKFAEMIYREKPLPIYGSTSLERDYTFVADVTAAILAALNSDLGFEVINIGNSRPVPISRIVSLLEAGIGKKAKLENVGFQKGDAKATCADISKAKKLFGYSPSISIEEGIERFVGWYLKSRKTAGKRKWL